MGGRDSNGEGTSRVLLLLGVLMALPALSGDVGATSSPLSAGTGGNNLQGLAAITDRNVRAVGYQVNSSNMPQTLIEQYCC